MSPGSITIRRAVSSEAEALSALAVRSKAHWPYPEALLQRYQSELEVHEAEVAAGWTFVAVGADQSILGFYALSSDQNRARLEFLFVEPTFIGRGYGKRLWLHALDTPAAATGRR